MLAAVLVALAVQAAPATPSPPTSPLPIPATVIQKPDWKKVPDRNAFWFVYPKAARKARIDGRATLLCDVLASGSLNQCSIIKEAPVGWGFGDAALALAPRFQMKPVTPDGRPVAGGTLTLPIVFKAP